MKTHSFLLTLGSCLGLSLLASPAHAALLAHYSFDADFTDGSGNSNDLTTANGTPNITTVGGETVFGGGALNLVNADQEWLTLATTIEFTGSEAWSVSFWAKKAAVDGRGMVMGNNDDRRSFIWSTNNFDGMRFRPESSNSASNDFTAPKDSSFHHYVMVADGTGQLSLYIDNGTPEVINPAASGTSFKINTIGDAYDGNTTLAFDGQLDEIYIFDEAVDSTTVGNLFSTNTIPEPGSLALLGLSGFLVAFRRRR